MSGKHRSTSLSSKLGCISTSASVRAGLGNWVFTEGEWNDDCEELMLTNRRKQKVLFPNYNEQNEVVPLKRGVLGNPIALQSWYPNRSNSYQQNINFAHHLYGEQIDEVSDNISPKTIANFIEIPGVMSGGYTPSSVHRLSVSSNENSPILSSIIYNNNSYSKQIKSTPELLENDTNVVHYIPNSRKIDSSSSDTQNTSPNELNINCNLIIGDCNSSFSTKLQSKCDDVSEPDDSHHSETSDRSQKVNLSTEGGDDSRSHHDCQHVNNDELCEAVGDSNTNNRCDHFNRNTQSDDTNTRINSNSHSNESSKTNLTTSQMSDVDDDDRIISSVCEQQSYRQEEQTEEGSHSSNCLRMRSSLGRLIDAISQQDLTTSQREPNEQSTVVSSNESDTSNSSFTPQESDSKVSTLSKQNRNHSIISTQQTSFDNRRVSHRIHRLSKRLPKLVSQIGFDDNFSFKGDALSLQSRTSITQNKSSFNNNNYVLSNADDINVGTPNSSLRNSSSGITPFGDFDAAVSSSFTETNNELCDINSPIQRKVSSLREKRNVPQTSIKPFDSDSDSDCSSSTLGWGTGVQMWDKRQRVKKVKTHTGAGVSVAKVTELLKEFFKPEVIRSITSSFNNLTRSCGYRVTDSNTCHLLMELYEVIGIRSDESAYTTHLSKDAASLRTKYGGRSKCGPRNRSGYCIDVEGFCKWLTSSHLVKGDQHKLCTFSPLSPTSPTFGSGHVSELMSCLQEAHAKVPESLSRRRVTSVFSSVQQSVRSPPGTRLWNICRSNLESQSYVAITRIRNRLESLGAPSATKQSNHIPKIIYNWALKAKETAATKHANSIRLKLLKHLGQEGIETENNNVSYRKQANLEMVSPQALNARMNLRHRKDIREGITTVWSLLPKSPGYPHFIDKQIYVWFNSVIISNIASSERITNNELAESWSVDSRGHWFLDEESLSMLVFEFVDNWCGTVDPSEYLKLISDIQTWLRKERTFIWSIKLAERQWNSWKKSILPSSSGRRPSVQVSDSRSPTIFPYVDKRGGGGKLKAAARSDNLTLTELQLLREERLKEERLLLKQEKQAAQEEFLEQNSLRNRRQSCRRASMDTRLSQRRLSSPLVDLNCISRRPMGSRSSVALFPSRQPCDRIISLE